MIDSWASVALGSTRINTMSQKSITRVYSMLTLCVTTPHICLQRSSFTKNILLAHAVFSSVMQKRRYFETRLSSAAKHLCTEILCICHLTPPIMFISYKSPASQWDLSAAYVWYASQNPGIKALKFSDRHRFTHEGNERYFSLLTLFTTVF